jgi:hypothetical protein
MTRGEFSMHSMTMQGLKARARVTVELCTSLALRLLLRAPHAPLLVFIYAWSRGLGDAGRGSYRRRWHSRTARPAPRDRAQRCARHLPSASFLHAHLSSTFSLTASPVCKILFIYSSTPAAGSVWCCAVRCAPRTPVRAAPASASVCSRSRT